MKLIFFDIDGTLAMPGNGPSIATVEAIRACRNKGNKVFLSTGRTKLVVPNEISNIGFDGGIYSAGGRIIAEEKEIWRGCMSPELVARIIDVLENNRINYSLECENCLYDGTVELKLDGVDEEKGSSELQRVLEMRKKLGNRYPISQYNGEDVYKITFTAVSEGQIDILKSELEKEAKVVAFDNLLRNLPIIAGEISDFKINKGFALEYICNYYQQDVSQSIAFGDSMNDSEIIIQAGIGIAMGNSCDELKNLADIVCESCENDGVSKMLIEMGLC
jgi:Cof subfamily protein (haloacid dehalogenase superfamily)